MNWAIEFFPYIGGPYLWGICAVIAVAIFVMLFMRRQGAVFRILSLLLLLLIIANPQFKQERRKPLKNIVVAVIDESDSQAIAKRKEIAQAIKAKLSDGLKQFDQVEVRWVTVKNNPSTVRREDSGTQLFDQLKKSLSGIPSNLLSGIFLVTDGQIHDVPANAKFLGENVPVHTLITGRNDEADRRIEIVKAPKFGLVGSEAFVKLRVAQHGKAQTFSGEAVVRIKRQKRETEIRVVKPGEVFEFSMQFPHAGDNVVEIELEPVKGELTEVNNRVAIVAQGVRENLRVLLVSGEPHAGERTWRNLLKSDASVDLVHFTILRPPEKQDGTPINQLSLIAFPTRQLFSEKLDQFDLIIFDRYKRRGVLPLLYLDNIVGYVKNGGAILVAAGDTFSSSLSLYSTPLAGVLPAAPTGKVIEEPYKAKVTDAGRRHPVTRGLPGDAKGDPKWGKWFRLVQVKPKDGDILMKGHEDNPLLVLNRVENGRVALLLSDHAWLWARGYDGGGPYISLLRRLAHWLMKEPDLEEEYLSSVVNGQKIVVERRSMRDQVEDVVVQAPDGTVKTLKLNEVKSGVWSAVVDAELSGLYRFQSGSLSSLAYSGVVNSLEMSDVSATDKLIKPIADATGGGVFWQKANSVEIPRIALLGQSRSMYGQNWMGLKDRKAYEVEGVVYVPIAPGVLLLLLLSGLIGLSWYREGR